MFLVYVPIISVPLYYLATKCLPDPARRTISKAASDAVVAFAIAMAKVVRYMVALRSAYIWDRRIGLARPFVNILDRLLNVDVKQVVMDTSTGHKSVTIRYAVTTVGGFDHDITKILQEMWNLGDGLRITVPINVVLECLHVNDLDQDSDVVTRVQYSGHSNIKKKYPSRTFSARYKCKPSEVFRFPPYASSEKIRRGLGVARITRANFVRNNGSMLYGKEAEESSGLRRNFYVDVVDDPFLEKKVITFFDPSARYQEEDEVLVTTSNFLVSTSNMNSKILCNSKIPS